MFEIAIGNARPFVLAKCPVSWSARSSTAVCNERHYTVRLAMVPDVNVIYTVNEPVAAGAYSALRVANLRPARRVASFGREVDMDRFRWTLALALVPLACAASLPANAPREAQPETITLRTPGQLASATLDGTRLFGPELEVARYGDAYRGHSARGVVDLRSSDGTIEGVVGWGRTELHLESVDANGFRVRGMNAGTLGELEVRSDRIVGQLGGCAYDLREASNACGVKYSGSRVCKGLPEVAELALPPSVVALDPLGRAALLAIFLGG